MEEREEPDLSPVKLDWRPRSQDSSTTTRRKYLLAPEIPKESNGKEVRFEVESKEDESKKKIKRKKNRLSKSASLDPYDGDRENKRQSELKERHMKLVDDMHRLKKFYHAEYMDGLMEKVERQRKEIQRHSDEMMKKIELKKLKEKEAARHLKKRKPRSALDNDNTFLESLPKARMYRICALETKLQNEGKFKTIEDREKFWDDITKPENYSLMFGYDESMDSGSYMEAPYTSKVSSTTYQETLEEPETAFLSLGLIREDTEPISRPSAVNGKSDSKQSSAHSSTTPDDRRKSIVVAGHRRKHPKVIEFEEKFKRIEFPKLSAFTLDLEPPKEDPEVFKIKQEFKQRANARRHAKKQLQKMYEISLTHLAATQRMLDKNQELVTSLEGPSLSDVVFSIDKNRNVAHSENTPIEEDTNHVENEVPQPPEENNISLDNIKDSILSMELEDNLERCTYSNSIESSNEGEMDDCLDPYPLTLEAVMEKKNVLEAKRAGVFWYNYGKFLPSITA